MRHSRYLLRVPCAVFTILVLLCALHLSGGCLGELGGEEPDEGEASAGLGKSTTSASDPLREAVALNMHTLTEARYHQMVRNAGFGWVRLEAIWKDLQPRNEPMNAKHWKVLDDAVHQARDKGLGIYMTVSYTPGWAVEPTIIGSPLCNMARMDTCAPDRKHWYAFVSMLVQRYKDRVTDYGMWNEPNESKYFSSGAVYFREHVIKPGYKAVRAVCPGCRVHGPEVLIHTSGGHGISFLRTVLRQGGKDHLDGLTVHIYPDPGDHRVDAKELFATLDEVQKVVLSEGVPLSMPLWITETGWTTDQVSVGYQAKAYLGVLTVLAQRVGRGQFPQRVFFYDFIDDIKGNRFGIVQMNEVPKPAYGVVRSFLLPAKSSQVSPAADTTAGQSSPSASSP